MVLRFYGERGVLSVFRVFGEAMLPCGVLGLFCTEEGPGFDVI